MALRLHNTLTRRTEEFAPIKNATGVDSAESCRAMLVEEWARWIEETGGEVPRTGDGTVDGCIEIGPVFALDAEALKKKLKPGFKMKSGVDLLLHASG